MPRRKLILCEVFHREFCLAAAQCPHALDLEFIEHGLHSKTSAEMCAALQGRVDACPPELYDYILLGYGLCNNGLVGLRARGTPLVLPRAHDCITLFLGSRRRYDEVFKQIPGTYYLTSGWLERAHKLVDDLAAQTPQAARQSKVYEDYVKRFGQEEADYLMQALGGWQQHYERMVYIALGLGDEEKLRASARKEAADRGLRYEEIPGDLRLFHALVQGPPWDENEFLVVPPGQAVHPSYDERVLEARPA